MEMAYFLASLLSRFIRRSSRGVLREGCLSSFGIFIFSFLLLFGCVLLVCFLIKDDDDDDEDNSSICESSFTSFMFEILLAGGNFWTSFNL